MEKPFKCEECQEEFESADVVVNHIAQNHAKHLPPQTKLQWFGDKANNLITEG